MVMKNKDTNNRNHDSCYLLFTNHCTKCFMWIILLNNHNTPGYGYNHL